MTSGKKTSITILLPAGRLDTPLMKTIAALSDQYGFSQYLSTLQNLRLIDVPEEHVEDIKKEIAQYEVGFKGPGLFPIPRICIGKPHCNLGVIDTEELSQEIITYFKNRKKTKAKLKIAISGCILSCSGTRTSDIGIVANRKGYDVYAGGKGGPSPKVGIRIKRDIGEAELLETIETIIEFHDQKTGKKQRLYKLISDETFPFQKI
ncbi:MAG: nitrite reductase [Desulfobulbaceae bacterium]|nr:MAG: nitrite reductase [Desulfobulbaceae bacterium]